jgi:hypothetical protein
LLGLAGCDFAFGLQHLEDEHRVTGRYYQSYVTNDENFAPLVRDRVYAPGAISIAVTLDDGTQPPVFYRPDGTLWFRLARPGQYYRIAFNADGRRSEYQSRAADIAIRSVLAGRPDRLPLFGANVQFPYPPSTGSNRPAMIMSTGTYTQTATSQFGPTVMFDWRLAQIAPRAIVGMVEAGKHDLLYVVEPEIDTSIPALPSTAIKALSRNVASLTPNTTTVLAAPQPVQKNTCMRLAVPNGGIHDRLVAAVPRTYASSDANWYAFMAPAPETIGIAGALWVANAGYSPASDIDIAPVFHDPFAGTTLVAASTAVAGFHVQLPGTSSPVYFATFSSRYGVAERGTPFGCTQAKTTLASTVGIPGAITLDGIALDTDGKVVALDLTREVPITWELADAGEVHHFGVALHELANINNTTIATNRGAFLVAGQTAGLIDRSWLEPGHSYVVVVQASLGFASAAMGDWETLQLPLEDVGVTSYYFEVAAR